MTALQIDLQAGEPCIHIRGGVGWSGVGKDGMGREILSLENVDRSNIHSQDKPDPLTGAWLIVADLLLACL